MIGYGVKEKKKDKTHATPIKNTALSPHFLFLSRFSLQTNGCGNATVIKSLAVFTLADTMCMTQRFPAHRPLIRGSHTAASGMQVSHWKRNSEA